MKSKKVNIGPQMALSYLAGSTKDFPDGEKTETELTFLSDLVNGVRKQGQMTKQTRNELRRDNRIASKSWNGDCSSLQDSAIPDVIRRLVRFVLEDYDIIDDSDAIQTSSYRVRYVASMPAASVCIAEGVGKVAARGLFHFGAGEVYILEKPQISEINQAHATASAVGDMSMLYNRSIYIPSNSYHRMDNGIVADVTIKIPSTPPSHKPMTMGGAPVGFIRIPKQKFTILVDILDNEDGVEGLINEAVSNMSKMKTQNPASVFANKDGVDVPTKSEKKDIEKDIGL
jgi:hypothetical protein